MAGPGRGQRRVAAGLNLRIAKPTRPPNPDGVEATKVRPLQGWMSFDGLLIRGFHPASRG